jgi:multidrug efflux system membrane fusion protein
LIGKHNWRWPLLVVAVLAAHGGWHHFTQKAAAERQAAMQTGPAPAPVRVAAVESRPFPVVLNGLGTVQATNTVTVRSRVDGQIEKVAFDEGQMVKEGDLLVQIDPAPFQATLNQAVAKLAQDQASLTNAKQDLERTTILSKQGNATQQLLDQRTAAVASLAAQIQADQAAIDSAKVQLAYTTIRSPLTGRAGFRLVDPGNIVHANDQNGVLTITQIEPISVIFTAPEQQLPAIRDGLKAGPMQVSAFTSDGKTKLADGTLKLIDNQVDVASGTVRLKASFDNHNGALWPGLSVTTRLLVNTINDAVVVSDQAVQRGPAGLYVYVVNANSKAEMRKVDVSRIEGGLAMVDKGLSPGEHIVTAGHYRVVPGGPVQVLDDQARRAANAGISKVD